MSMTTLSAALEADCSRCVALCCVLLAFDRSDAFAFDKASGQTCQHLTRAWRCGIHDELAAEGMGGCAAYDCQGAGPRAVQVLGLESSTRWPGDEQAMSEVAEVFGVLRRIHELLLLLQAAASLVTTAQKTDAEPITACVAAASASASSEELLLLDVGALSREVHAFVRSLMAPLPRQSPRRRLSIVSEGKAQAPGGLSVVEPNGASGRCSTRKSTKLRTLGES